MRSVGTRIITGSDKSYRRAMRRSVITPILLDASRRTHESPAPLSLIRPYYSATSNLGDDTGIASFALWENWPGTYRPHGPVSIGTGRQCHWILSMPIGSEWRPPPLSPFPQLEPQPL